MQYLDCIIFFQKQKKIIALGGFEHPSHPYEGENNDSFGPLHED
jgi:hypothetical protein